MDREIAGRGRVYLCDDKDVLVTRYHISCVVGRLECEGLFAAEDRTGFDGLLHRVGVIRDKVSFLWGYIFHTSPRRFVVSLVTGARVLVAFEVVRDTTPT